MAIKKIMEPVSFKEQNVVYGKGQEQYKELPGFRNKSDYAEFVSCWKIPFWQRFRVLITGKMWLTQCTFNKPLTPVNMSTEKPEFVVEQKEEE